MTSADTHRHRLGSTLVALQFTLLLALALLVWPALARAEFGLAGVGLLVLSVALGGWTLLHNRLGNFNIHPQPKTSGYLVVDGPYRHMRHPMYSAVLLLAGALAVVAGLWIAAVVWLALLAVLWRKAELEERWLTERYPDYSAYRSRTKRFVPGLF